MPAAASSENACWVLDARPTLVSAFCAAASSRPSTLGTGVGVSGPFVKTQTVAARRAAERATSTHGHALRLRFTGYAVRTGGRAGCGVALGRVVVATSLEGTGNGAVAAESATALRPLPSVPVWAVPSRRSSCWSESRERAPASKERNSAASVGRRSGSRAPAAETISSSTLGVPATLDETLGTSSCTCWKATLTGRSPLKAFSPVSISKRISPAAYTSERASAMPRPTCSGET
jgi:hypothetical protein